MGIEEFFKYITQVPLSNIDFPITINNVKPNESLNYSLSITSLFSFLLLKDYMFYPKIMYNGDILITGENDMKEKLYYFRIPYNSREKYIDIVYDVNNMISHSGYCELNVNNIPGHLDSILAFIDGENNVSKIRQYLISNGIYLCEDMTFKDLMIAKSKKQWSGTTLVPNMPKNEIEEIFGYLYFFKSDEQLQQDGYSFEKEYKPKVFISYSWKDDNYVKEFADILMASDINIWIDKKDIEGGNHILQSIMEGIEECDMAIFFISNAFKNSIIGKRELVTFFTNVTLGKKQWRICKIDDVDPDDIFPSLSQYKYIEWQNREELLESVYRGIDKIKEQHKIKKHNF